MKPQSALKKLAAPAASARYSNHINRSQTPDNYKLMQKNPLAQLIQEDQFVGWVCQLDYVQAVVVTNDLWKIQARGIPLNCFLLATAIDPKFPGESKETAREIILLRVSGSAALPVADQLLRAKVENFKNRTATISAHELDEVTKSELQFSGLECRVLGTFFEQNGALRLGSDIESYLNAAELKVYCPKAGALETIINYISPERAAATAQEAVRLGFKNGLPRFPIGTVRYTSTDRQHRGDVTQHVKFYLNAVDFLSRRTAVLGMTRTGKSNTIKQLVSVVMRTSSQGGLKIGQIIYDLNGEYANANQQDKGSIAEVYPKDTIRYRILPVAGFQPILNNFYTQIQEGHATVRALIEAGQVPRSPDVEAFLSITFDEPRREDFEDEKVWAQQHARYQRKTAAYQTVLARAGFELPEGFKIKFEATHTVRQLVNPTVDPRDGLTPVQAATWFDLARQIQEQLYSTGTNPWFDPDTKALVNLLLQKNDQGGYIPGYRLLQPYKEYHSPSRTSDVSEEIYKHLVDGKIVILDLSVGDAAQRDRLSKRIAQHIFKSSMANFNLGQHPPHIVIYIEEAHNLIGRNEALTETWPRIVKEGAKARIATVYATQEVSSIHPNILSNTENIFVSHLNNENEFRELAKFYDFRDFESSIMHTQDVGFNRVKTLSNPFVIPVQIDKFNPELEKQRAG